MKASSTYTIEQVRDPKWVKENGHTPTLMDYSRFNYVAQPEDKIDPADLIPKIGPYDKWATMWGYKPIPGAKTPEDEKTTLDKWAREQDEKPYLRFSTDGTARHRIPARDRSGRRRRRRAPDDARPQESRARVEMLLPRRPRKWAIPGELEEVYGRMVGQWTTEMNHVARRRRLQLAAEAHRPGRRRASRRRASDRQQQAVQFLNARVQTPTF